VRAVCDGDPNRLGGTTSRRGNLGDAGPTVKHDSAEIMAYRDVDQLLADEHVDLVSICTYTDSHVDLALRALSAGKHVLVEKPVALRAADVQRLREAAARTDRRCMPAMCMRFWPGWNWLHDRIKDQSFGPIRSVAFTRLGSGPGWASEFYRDASRSGGAMFDLHIHDADFVHWCFGPPASVESNGSVNHLTTSYHFKGGPSPVCAEGGWSLPPDAPFQMRYVAIFEHATATFDLMRSPLLQLHRGNQSEWVAIPSGTGYDGEIRHLLECAIDPSRPLRATLDDAVAVTLMLEAERTSLERGGSVSIR
jgi:predicted dehydrogenase